MTPEMILTMIMLTFAVVLFVFEWVRVDVVGIIMMVMLPLVQFGWRGGLPLAGAMALLVFTIPIWEVATPPLQGMTPQEDSQRAPTFEGAHLLYHVVQGHVIVEEPVRRMEAGGAAGDQVWLPGHVQGKTVRRHGDP